MPLPPEILEAAWKKLVSGAPGAWITLHPAKNDEQKALLAEALEEAYQRGWFDAISEAFARPLRPVVVNDAPKA